MKNRRQKGNKILEVENLSKEFPGVKALSNFDFELHRGEVHCLIGENGAGKSTFIKILSGFFKPNSGKMFIDGYQYSFLNPYLARKIGIQTVYQEDILVPQISASENIFLGSEKKNQKLFVSYKGMVNRAKKLANNLGIYLRIEEKY